MRLDELRRGERARISRVHGAGTFRKRILEMGFVQGQEVEMLGKAPLGDPYRFEVMGYCVTLRREEAGLIEVVQIAGAGDVESLGGGEYVEQPAGEGGLRSASSRTGKTDGGSARREIRVALVGNPNSGKTTLFNRATGMRERTGNYGGVTIDSKTARFTHGDYLIILTDLPGTYSLTAYSPEESYVRSFLDKGRPDVVINVADSTSLARSLYLTLQLRELGLKVALALNMYDDLKSCGGRINRVKLGEMLGVLCTPTVGCSGLGVSELFDSVVALHEGFVGRDTDVIQAYGIDIAGRVQAISGLLSSQARREGWSDRTTRYYSLRALERDREFEEELSAGAISEGAREGIRQEVDSLEKSMGADSETCVTDARYAYVSKVLRMTYVRGAHQKQKEQQRRIDRILTHRWFGLPIFFALMYFVFWLTFTVGEYPLQWIERAVNWLGLAFSERMESGPLRDLISGALIGGVGNVVVFLPHIMILFFCLSLLEDSGYMPRAVFLVDRIMRSAGLHGHSFIPLVMGFGCNVPAVMATRAIADRKVRMVTMLVNPFMSCSARLPVYVLLIYSIFPKYQGLILFGVYFLGIAVAMGVSLLFRKVLLHGADAPFAMELPLYRMPSLRASLRHMWHKAAQYLRKIGTVILLASAIIWFLSYFPSTTPQDAEFSARRDQLEQELALLAGAACADSASVGVMEFRDSLRQSLAEVSNARLALQQRNSLLGRIGRAIEPAIEPLGFDWRIGVSLLSGVAAKEVVVSTLGALLQVGDADEESVLLRERVRTVRVEHGARAGELLFTPLVALSLLVFSLLYMPCIATIAAIKKELGGWGWALFAALYTTALAYVFSLLVYQIGSLL